MVTGITVHSINWSAVIQPISFNVAKKNVWKRNPEVQGFLKKAPSYSCKMNKTLYTHKLLKSK